MKRFITIAILILPVLFACTEASQDGDNSASSVVLGRDKVDLLVGESTVLTATVLPASLGMGVVWSVLDPDYAEIQQDGTLSAKAEGVTYAIATSADGTQKAACMVSVNPPVLYTVSILDEDGHPLAAVNGYPGQQLALSASTSDGEIHEFTWSVEDEANFSITADEGLLSMGAVPSTDAAYAYDASSFVKAVTEDGFYCRIPIRSSMLMGVMMNQVVYYQPSGTIVPVEADKSYSVSVLYEGEFGPEVIPADKLNAELSNTDNFSIMQISDSFALVTGEETGVSTQFMAGLAGSEEKVALAEFTIAKVYPIQAALYATSSSTLVFTWTERVSAADDVSHPYKITLYKDADATDVVLSYDIPAEHACWKGEQPRFVFSGLEAATDYWFKVTDTSSDVVLESDLIPAQTDAFEIVMVSADPAEVGDIILAEDFGQLCWGADEINKAAGIDVADANVGYNSDTKKSFTYRDAASFVSYTGQYAQRSLTAQSTAKKEAGVRFAKWAQGQYARIYIGPGYLFLSTVSYGTHIITPELTSIPEGMTATLKVTLHAAGFLSGGDAALAVQHNKSFNEISSGTQTNKNKLDLTSNVKTITFNGGITSLEEFEVTIEGVVQGDRIAFGPTSESTKSNSNMMLISDMTVQIIDLK